MSLGEDYLTTHSLGIGNASGAGTKQTTSTEKFAQVLQTEPARDARFAAALEHAGALGLRSQKSEQRAQSIATWLIAMDKDINKPTLVFSTKGRGVRETTIINRELVK